MKHNDIPNIPYKITSQNYENVFNVYEDENGFYLYNLLTSVNFPTDLDPNFYTIYETLTNDTWTGISWKFYNTIKLWWVICTVNQVKDAVTPPTPGSKIKILKLSTVRTILSMLEGS